MEAAYYETPTSVAGKEINIPRQPSLTLRKHVLTVRKPEKAKFNFTVFKKSFPFNQFSHNEEDHIRVDDENAVGETVIMLRVPKNVNLNAGEELVEYVQDSKY